MSQLKLDEYQIEAIGAIRSASTVNLEEATGDLVEISGTTTINRIILYGGHERTVRFTGALTLTNSSTLVLPTDDDITTVAGSFAVFRGYNSGIVRCVTYTEFGFDPQAPVGIPTVDGVVVSGIGAGTYTSRDVFQGTPIYFLDGQPTDLDTYHYAFGSMGDAYPDNAWIINNANGDSLNTSTSTGQLYPNLATWTGSTVTAQYLTLTGLPYGYTILGPGGFEMKFIGAAGTESDAGSWVADYGPYSAVVLYDFGVGAETPLLPAVPAGRRRIPLSINLAGAATSSADGPLNIGWGDPNVGSISTTTLAAINVDTKTVTIAFSGPSGADDTASVFTSGIEGDILKASYGGAVLPGVVATLTIQYMDIPA